MKTPTCKPHIVVTGIYFNIYEGERLVSSWPQLQFAWQKYLEYKDG